MKKFIFLVGLTLLSSAYGSTRRLYLPTEKSYNAVKNLYEQLIHDINFLIKLPSLWTQEIANKAQLKGNRKDVAKKLLKHIIENKNLFFTGTTPALFKNVSAKPTTDDYLNAACIHYLRELGYGVVK